MKTILIGLVVGTLVSQFGTLATTIYLHRCLSHRAITLSRPVTGFFRAVLWVTTGLRPRQWVAVHRKHHAHSDEPGDPHSPILEGFAAVQFGNVGLYRKVARDQIAVARYARDLPPDRWDKALLDRAFLGLGLGIAFLCLVLGWKVGLIAAAWHAVGYLLLNAAVNAVGHTFGSRPNPNLARNNQWLAWLTSGEGLHNNHHDAPTSARFTQRRGEIDPGWWVVRWLERRGWATVRHADRRVSVAA